jgi:hypothetical protein
VYITEFTGNLCTSIEKLKHLKGSLAEAYYEMSSKKLPCFEMKIMGINGVIETLV